MKNVVKILISIFLVVLGGTFSAEASKKETIPTFFIHGYGSSYRAEQKMVAAAPKKKVTKTVVLVNVDMNGQAHFKQELPKDAKDPIIEVNFENNKNVNAMMESQYLKSVITLVQTKYDFKKMNIVAHSMGNSAVLFYLRDNAGDKSLPRLNKEVALAAFPNGLVDEMPKDITVEKDGKPSVFAGDFTNFLPLKESYPKNAKVLNIYGDVLDGSQADGYVPVKSAKTLRYLVTPNASSYQELEIKGKNGQHSKLHNNKKVNQALIKFLWNK